MKILLASNNPSKREQIRPFLADLPVPLLTMQEAGVVGESLEDGLNHYAIAIDKAMYARQQLQDHDYIVIGEDTGISIEALGGQPGIHSKRWAGPDATTDQIMQHVLRQMEGKENRRAVFICAAAVLTPKGKPALFSGRVAGKLLTAPACEPQLQMPYSPLFQPDGSDKVWAQMSVEEENAISHRGIVFRQVREYLETLFL